MTPARQLDWRSHAHSLETLKQQVNQLGQTLTTLEELKPQANEGQRMAIDKAASPGSHGRGTDTGPESAV